MCCCVGSCRCFAGKAREAERTRLRVIVNVFPAAGGSAACEQQLVIQFKPNMGVDRIIRSMVKKHSLPEGKYVAVVTKGQSLRPTEIKPFSVEPVTPQVEVKF